jgi:DNA-binding MarR family transcriptional regulator
MAGVSHCGKSFTPKQGQYLAFIHLYTRLHRRPPAETDMKAVSKGEGGNLPRSLRLRHRVQQYFRVSPPSVHQMVLTLERAGLIRRKPRTARSIELLVDPKQLPELL